MDDCGFVVDIFYSQHSITANPNDNVCVSLWVGADRSEAGFFVGGSRSGGDDNGLDATMVFFLLFLVVDC